MDDFKIEGLDEFLEKLKKVEKKAPDRILYQLDDMGKDLRKEIRSNMPKSTGNLRKGVTALPVEKIKGGWQKGITNKAPHYHLVERGHRKVSKSGRELGWTPGYFYLEKTVMALDSAMTQELKLWLDELFKELK